MAGIRGLPPQYSTVTEPSLYCRAVMKGFAVSLCQIGVLFLHTTDVNLWFVERQI